MFLLLSERFNIVIEKTKIKSTKNVNGYSHNSVAETMNFHKEPDYSKLNSISDDYNHQFHHNSDVIFENKKDHSLNIEIKTSYNGTSSLINGNAKYISSN